MVKRSALLFSSLTWNVDMMVGGGAAALDLEIESDEDYRVVI